MAINQANIAVNSCAATVRCVNSILMALDELEAIKEQLAGAGINLVSVGNVAAIEDNVIENVTTLGDSRTRHCEAATFKNIIDTFAPQIKVALEAYYSGSPTQQGWAAFQKARSK